MHVEGAAGQVSPVPVQVDASLQSVALAAWQTYVFGRLASVGHAAAEPVHFSATSHAPADARHVTVLASNAFAGQLAELPVQVSAMSHTPALARHTVVLDANASVGHDGALPLQYSATSHAPADPRHNVMLV